MDMSGAGDSVDDGGDGFVGGGVGVTATFQPMLRLRSYPWANTVSSKSIDVRPQCVPCSEILFTLATGPIRDGCNKPSRDRRSIDKFQHQATPPHCPKSTIIASTSTDLRPSYVPP